MTVLAGVGESFQQTAATGPVLLALGACVLAGLVSFASPCVVPLVPGYLSYLAGLVGAEAPPATAAEAAEGRVATVTPPDRAAKLRVAGAAGLLVAGFTVVLVGATAPDDLMLLDPGAARALLRGAPWRRYAVLGDSIA